jgi:hypothetical protein
MHPVTLVEESPFAAFSAHPRICLLYNAQFVGLSSAMLWFDGKTSWTVVSDLPRCYLLAGLSWNKGLTQRFYGAEAQQVPHFEAGLSDRENQIPKTPEEFREWAIEDMPRLAALIEEKLNLEHKLSLGVEVSAESLELPLVEDSAGRGNQTANVYLVAHPEAFLQKRTPTSPWDRLLHFWITDDEYGRLFDLLHGTAASKRDFQMLARIAEQDVYGSLAFQFADVVVLAAECEVIAGDSNAQVGEIVEKILLVCRSAMAYNLGLVVEGN